MSLNWSVEKCENKEELLNEDNWPRTEQIIQLTMVVGIGKITKNNWKEFYCRLKFMDWGFRPEQIKRYIGLSTNVFPDESRAKWLKRYTEGFFRSTMFDLAHME